MTGSHWRRRLPHVRLYTDIAEWADWQRPKRARVKQVVMRRADNGMDVVVLKPTIWGRLVSLWRTWNEV